MTKIRLVPRQRQQTAVVVVISAFPYNCENDMFETHLPIRHRRGVVVVVVVVVAVVAFVQTSNLPARSSHLTVFT